jgi:predicted adenine nucleotide alpha hydrolase (AANH) superfamily ATPase
MKITPLRPAKAFLLSETQVSLEMGGEWRHFRFNAEQTSAVLAFLEWQARLKGFKLETLLTNRDELAQHSLREKKVLRIPEQSSFAQLARDAYARAPRIEEIPAQDLERKKKMLVHVCCGPDVAGVIEQLREDYELVAFWYDPNIQPQSEHDKRLDAFLKVVETEKVPYIVGEYDVDNFLSRIRGLEASPEQGAKCTHCYDMRLERAAMEAQRQNCELFTSSLAISPHKVQEKLAALGQHCERKYQVPYFQKNFTKAEGFKSSVEYSLKYEIYRQDYCGCWFSLHEGGPEARALATKWGLEKHQLAAGNYQLPSHSEETLS